MTRALDYAVAVACALLSEHVEAQTRNLLANPDFQQGNAGFSSQYRTPCRGQGTYCVVKDAGKLNRWWTGGDRSGSGLFMIVDGAKNASLIAWAQTVAVVPNSKYTLEYWYRKVDWPTNDIARLEMRINGVVVGGTVRPTSLRWTKFSRTWNSGPATTARIELRDVLTQSGGNGGDDFGIDDMAFLGPAPDVRLAGKVYVGQGSGRHGIRAANVEVVQAGKVAATAVTIVNGDYSMTLPSGFGPGRYTIRATSLAPTSIRNFRYPNSTQTPTLGPDKDPIQLRAGLNTGLDVVFPQPVVFVHGFTGSAETWAEAVRVLREDPAKKSQRGVAARAYFCWSVSYGPGLSHLHRSHRNNAAALRTQIDGVRRIWTVVAPSGPKFDIVAHSMGGLVARAYLHHDATAGEVDRLLTFGTPHAGVSLLVLLSLAQSGRPCDTSGWPSAFAEMHPCFMAGFNARVTNTRGARLILVTANADKSPAVPALPWWGTWDDGVVSTYSGAYPVLHKVVNGRVLAALTTNDWHGQLTSNTPNQTIDQVLLPALENVR